MPDKGQKTCSAILRQFIGSPAAAILHHSGIKTISRARARDEKKLPV